MFVLAIVLGYIYIYTKNILFPIIFHFLNNGIGVIIHHYNSDGVSEVYPEVNQMPTLYLIIVVIGILIFLSQKKPRESIRI